MPRPNRVSPLPLPTAPPALGNGIFDLPPGKIAAIATFLELTRPAAPLPEPGLGAARLEPLDRDPGRYRALYGRVGRPWLWFSRAALSDAALLAIVADPAVDAMVLVVDGQDVGLLELDWRSRPDCELAFLGLVPEAAGRGLGRRLLAEGVRRAFDRPAERLWLHTCSLDHPAALPLYLKAGFRPFRRAVEIADDPRLSGHLPPDAAPLFPRLV